VHVNMVIVQGSKSTMEHTLSTLSSGEVSIAVATRLIDHNSVKLFLTRNFWNNLKSVEIWGKCQLGKVFQI
jgi:hypothetical protein